MKLSFVSFYIRVFGVMRVYRIMGYCLVAFIVAWLVMSILLAFFACFTFELTWNPMASIKDCSSQVGLSYTTAVLDLVADISIFAMPLRPISKLQINNNKRLVLFFIFGLGFS